MYYTCSISMLLNYKHCDDLRFNESLGLGNRISQGEETDFVERVVEKSNPVFKYIADVYIYHPRKTNYPANVFYSLSYFLSYKLRRSKNKNMYIRYSLFFYFKYITVGFILFFKFKYRSILFNVLKGFFDGYSDKLSVF